jgi:hypothetical protein
MTLRGRLSVRAPFRGTHGGFVGMWVRGRVLCGHRVIASPSLFIEGYASPPGAGTEGGLVRFEREKSSLQTTFVPFCQGVVPHTRVYAKMELTSSNFDTGRQLAAVVGSKRVDTPHCR